MDFSFGIITTGGVDDRILTIIESIEYLKIPNYEIIIVGNCGVQRSNVTVIAFDESIKRMWITRKKNIITEHAKYENIVFLHDYVALDKNWYEGFKQFGNNFKVCMTRLEDIHGNRHQDWVIIGDSGIVGSECMIPYDMNLSKIQYMPGNYWIAKKSFMEQFPLNENLIWGQGEDGEWSLRITKQHQFSMNPYSTARYLKEKHRGYSECSEATIKILNAIQKYERFINNV